MFDLGKWGILIKVLPYAGLFSLAKVGMHELGWEWWTFDNLTGILFNATTFVIALVLSGTLNDYARSEAMPAQIADALEAVQDLNRTFASTHADYQPQPLLQCLVEIDIAILAWLQNNAEFEVVESQIDRLNPLIVPILERDRSELIVSRIHAEQAKIRSIVRQMRGSRDTDCLGQAYVLMWLFLCGSIVALLLIRVNEFSESLLVSTLMFSAFVYLLFLIQDLDNPFEYDGKSCVDVDLGALIDVRNRLSAKKLD